MVGEGLGRHPDHDALYEALFERNNETTDVVSIGSLVVDRTIDPLEHGMYDVDMADEDWFPTRGESVTVDAVPEYVDDLPHDLYSGGRGPNQAVAAAYAGADTALVGKGTNEHGRLNAFYDLEQAGVTLNVEDGPNGEAYIFRDSSGDNRIACVRPPENRLTVDELERIDHETGTISDADYVLLNNDEPDDVLEYVLDHADDATIIFDPAPAAGAEALVQHESIDYVTPNAVEYRQLRDVLEGSEATVITTTSWGAFTDEYDVAAPRVDVKDTTGAGDTFNGYLAAGLSQGMEPEEATEYAVHAASLSVTRDGAQSAIPTFEEVAAFMDPGA